MADDDILRSMLEREANRVPYTHDAADALVAVGPALRRATVKRTSALVASTVLLLGGTVVAFNAVQPTEDEISVGSPVTQTSGPPTSTAAPTYASMPASSGDDVSTSTDGDDSAVPSPIEISGDDAHAGQAAPPTAAPGPPATAAPATAPRSGGGAPPTPAPQPTAPPATAPPTNTPAPTTAPPTGQQLTRYERVCGYVLADLATSPPTIIEIVPATGYQYLVEDPEHDTITVHFTGTGEDCEVKVGDADEHEDDHDVGSEAVDHAGDPDDD